MLTASKPMKRSGPNTLSRLSRDLTTGLEVTKNSFCCGALKEVTEGTES